MRKKSDVPFVESVDESVWYQLAIAPVRLPRKVEMPSAFNFDWSIVPAVVEKAEGAELTEEAGGREGEEAGEADGEEGEGADDGESLSCGTVGALGSVMTGTVVTWVRVSEAEGTVGAALLSRL